MFAVLTAIETTLSPMTMSDKSKHARGRPLLFDNMEDRQIRIDQRFLDCDTEFDARKFRHDKIVVTQDGDEPAKLCSDCRRAERSRGLMLVSGELKQSRLYTVTGLTVWLHTSRRTLLNYECREKFFLTIKAAKDGIEAYANEKLFDKDYPARGVIFSLSKNADD